MLCADQNHIDGHLYKLFCNLRYGLLIPAFGMRLFFFNIEFRFGQYWASNFSNRVSNFQTRHQQRKGNKTQTGSIDQLKCPDKNPG